MIKQTFISTGFVLAAVSTYPLTALATERQLDAHDHGHSFINIAMSDEELLIELISPAANIVGFEHAPKNDNDHQAIDTAVAQLRKGDEVFTINGAKCTLQDADVESSLLDANHEEEHGDEHKDEEHTEHDEHKDGKHADEHDEHKDGEHADEHDEHKDGEHAEHDDESSHSEFHVVWAFACTDNKGIVSVGVNLFTMFSGFEEIDVSVATERGQSAHELTPTNIQVNL